ncbi:MAG: hypothetical protein AAF902_12210 [Chloroflexota bacterium]
MALDLTISAVVLKSSLAHSSDQAKIYQVPCVELTLSDGSTFLGDCVLGSQHQKLFNEAEVVAGLSAVLVNGHLHDYLSLCQQIASATYTLQEYKLPDPADASAEDMHKRNRREILSKMGLVEQIEPELVLTDNAYLLPDHIVRGVTAALLEACAYAHQKSLGAYLVTLLKHSDQTPHLPKLGLDVSAAGQSALLKHASAICYTLPDGAGAESLGKSVEKLQRYLRELNGWIEAAWSTVEPTDRPWLFVDLQGSIHELNNRVMGKTLGTLFGFSTTGFQEKMIFANPTINTSPAHTIKDMRFLKSLMRSRKLGLQVAPSTWVDSTENVKAWSDSDKIDLLVIDLDQTANWGELVEMMCLAEAKSCTLILRSGRQGNERSWQINHSLAAAVNPLFYLPAGGERGYVQVINGSL